jgi:hypothetical protein
MPAMTELGSSTAAELTVSLAPAIIVDWQLSKADVEPAYGNDKVHTLSARASPQQQQSLTNYQRHISLAKVGINFLHLHTVGMAVLCAAPRNCWHFSTHDAVAGQSKHFDEHVHTSSTMSYGTPA